MQTGFSRTLRSLGIDRFRPSALGLLAAFVLLGAWGWWATQVRVPLYEVSTQARLEAAATAYPVQSPISGRVVSVRLELDQAVREGEVLVEIESSPEQFQIREEAAKAEALRRQREGVGPLIAAELDALTKEKATAEAAVQTAEANLRLAEAAEKLAKVQLGRIEQLDKAGLGAKQDLDRAKSEATQKGAVVDALRAEIRRIRQESVEKEAERRKAISKLEVDRGNLDAQLPVVQSAIGRLQNEVSRRRVVAPVTGRIAETLQVRPGAFVNQGEKLAAVLPEGGVRVVAQFPPAAAMGRLAAGQPARLRLDGFPWLQYGTLDAKVARVSSEIRDNAVRVELDLALTRPSPIPLQHGLPGTVEVEVERAPPFDLILRSAGRWITNPVGGITP